jgi:hypothetical protein
MRQDKRYISLLLASLLLVAFVHGQSRRYYITAAGKDNGNGKTAATGWRSLRPLAGVKLKGGDTVFLQRGGVYEGSVMITGSGRDKAPVVITAFGEGAAPVISGSVPVTDWKPIGNNRFEALVREPVFDLFRNNQRLTPARHPNSGFMTIEKAYGKDSIESSALQEPDGFWQGATLRIRPIDWVYETRMVKSYQKGLLIQGPQDRYLIEKSFEQRTLGGKTGIYNFQKGYGFYLEGLPAMVDTAGEWSWQAGKLVVQLPEGERPNNSKLHAVVQPYGVWLAAGVRHVTIQGLEFRQLEKAGIGGAGMWGI